MEESSSLPADLRGIKARLDADSSDLQIGRSLVVLSACSSTNDLAHEGGRAGETDGAVYIADSQMSGRGQKGRNWLATPGACLLISFLLRPELAPSDVSAITMMSASAAAAAIDNLTGLECTLKWPNDLFIGGAGDGLGRKVGGILLESSFSGESLEYVVIGIGINVSFNPALYPEISESATSLSKEIGHEIARDDLALQLIVELDRRYRGHRLGGEAWLEATFREWESRLGTLGRRLKVVDGGQRPELDGRWVRAMGVSRSGALIINVESEDGEVGEAGGQLVELALGEVSVR